MPTPSYDLASWRSRVPLLARSIPMNHCSHAPQLDVTRAAAEAYLDSWNRNGMDWEAWMAEVEGARADFAALIGADAGDVAVCTSVSQATALVASALDFTGRRRKVVASGAEFPTVGHVWLAHERLGARVAWVPARDGVVPLGAYDAAIDEDTLLVSAAHAYYQSGFRQDVRDIARRAHARGALIYVDAYQSLGVADVDVRALDVDFLAGGCLKFLLGVPGIAFLYVRPGLAETLRPAATGWFGRAEPFAYRAGELTWAPGARRFDTGTPPVPNAFVARAGLGVIREVGVPAIEEWMGVLKRRLVEGGRARGLDVLGDAEPERSVATTAFRCAAADGDAVEAAMRRRGVLASARGPAVRLAPHFYSTLDDVEKALDALAHALDEVRR